LTNDIFEDLDAVCGSRQALYSFLSRLFERELTEAIIKELQERREAMGQLAPLKELGNKKLNEGLMNLESYLKESVATPREKVMEALSVEFKGLFLGVWGLHACPSESAYASGGLEAREEKRNQVMEMYRSVGLDKADAFTEPDDHVAVELQFMSYLSKETIPAARSRDQEKALELLSLQYKFLHSHLGRWIGLLSDDVIKLASSSFYRGASQVAAGFVEEDIKVLRDFIEDLQPSQEGG